MATPARRVARVASRLEAEASTSLEFREAGSERVHRGEDARFEDGWVQFHCAYGVSPGARLTLSLLPAGVDPVRVGVELLVERLDCLPDGRFRIAGRLRGRR